MLNITQTLRPYFTQAAVADAVTSLPKPLTPMTDLLFPLAARIQKPSPFINLEDVTPYIGAAPLIVRGGSSYPINDGSTKRQMIEVQPIALNKYFTAKEVNDMLAMGDKASAQAFVNDVIQSLRDKTSETIETMVCQSLSGTISYPISAGGTLASTWDLKLGDIKSLTAASIASAKIGDLLKIFEEQYASQADTGAASDVRFMLGSAVYAAIVSIVAASSNPPVQWKDYGFDLFGKYKCMSGSATYKLPGKSSTPIIAADQMQTVDLANAGKLFFAALDDLDANLAPLPFYCKPIKTDDPSGVKMVSESKPLPALAVSKMTKRKITT